MPPIVGITNPLNNQQVSGTINLQATVSDSVAISSVVARVNNGSPLNLTSSGGGTGVAGTATKSFAFDTAYRIRPGQGLTRNIGYLNPNGSVPNMTTLRGSKGIGSVRLVINLEDYTRTATLPGSVLAYIQNCYNAAQTAGVKLIWGICYSFGFKVFNPKDTRTHEPTLPIVRGHIDQLETITEDNKHLTIGYFFGIAGAWGEHFAFYSGQAFQGLCTEANLRALNDHLMLRYPSDRQIMNRYLRHSFEQPGTDFTGWYNAPISQAQAYGGTPRSRSTNHCDSMGQDGESFGWYGWENGTKYPYNANMAAGMASPTIQEQEIYMRRNHRWSINYGEGGTNDQFIPNGAGSASGFTRQQFIRYTKLRCYSHINYTDPDTFSKLETWMGGSDADSQEWRRTVGYNLWLKNYRIEVTPTQVIVNLEWENRGSAGLHHVYPLWLELGSVAIKLSDNIRMETPRGGETMSVQYSRPRPSGLTNGTYAIKFWLPDEHPALRDDWRYAIPISSSGMNFSSIDGRNDALQNITVASSGGTETNYTWSFNTNAIQNGTYPFTVTATNVSGQSTTATINIVFANPVDPPDPDEPPPEEPPEGDGFLWRLRVLEADLTNERVMDLDDPVEDLMPFSVGPDADCREGTFEALVSRYRIRPRSIITLETFENDAWVAWHRGLAVKPGARYSPYPSSVKTVGLKQRFYEKVIQDLKVPGGDVAAMVRSVLIVTENRPQGTAYDASLIPDLGLELSDRYGLGLETVGDFLDAMAASCPAVGNAQAVSWGVFPDGRVFFRRPNRSASFADGVNGVRVVWKELDAEEAVTKVKLLLADKPFSNSGGKITASNYDWSNVLGLPAEYIPNPLVYRYATTNRLDAEKVVPLPLGEGMLRKRTLVIDRILSLNVTDPLNAGDGNLTTKCVFPTRVGNVRTRSIRAYIAAVKVTYMSNAPEGELVMALRYQSDASEFGDSTVRLELPPTGNIPETRLLYGMATAGMTVNKSDVNVYLTGRDDTLDYNVEINEIEWFDLNAPVLQRIAQSEIVIPAEAAAQVIVPGLKGALDTITITAGVGAATYAVAGVDYGISKENQSGGVVTTYHLGQAFDAEETGAKRVLERKNARARNQAIAFRRGT
jgi:hypothetical protein